MKGKDYLETRRKQDELLAQVDDSTPEDDPKIKELLSLQDDCDGFEREYLHIGYDELKLDLDIRTIVGAIRIAHEAGMNVSDFFSMAICEYMDVTEEITWTTNLLDPNEDSGKGYPAVILEKAMNKRGWKTDDFVRVTLTDDDLTIRNLHID